MFKSETDAAEEAVSNAVQTLQQANTLGTQGATETCTPEQRQSLAGQVDASIRQVLASANTETAGRYLFSGDTDQVAPYSIDSSGNVSAYNGSASTRQAMHPNGTTFAIARSGQEVFEAPAGAWVTRRSSLGLRHSAFVSACLKRATAAAFQSWWSLRQPSRSLNRGESLAIA